MVELTSEERALLEELWSCQKTEGLSDSALADRMEVVPSLISHLKAERRRPGLKLILAASRTFPRFRFWFAHRLTTDTQELPVVESREPVDQVSA